MNVHDTIAAIASAPGPADRGIVRISGPNTVAILSSVFDASDGSDLQQLNRPSVLDGQIKVNETCVSGHLMVWPTTQSFTRQPTGEFHTIGSAPVLDMVLSAFCKDGARLANAGEFTLRAFLSGRIDLTQAEAVLAVIDSEGEEQLDVALQQLAGGLAGPLGNLRTELLSVLAELEAGLDFVEEDIEFISSAELESNLNRIGGHLKKVIEQIENRGLSDYVPKVVLVGRPNSGKSSLFNALSKSEQAIVTDVAGTTTDFISTRISAGGTTFELIDTAGAEEKVGQISLAAQEHRVHQSDMAQIRVLCIDGVKLALTSPSLDWEIEFINCSQPELIAITKCDLVDDFVPLKERIQSFGFGGPVVASSSLAKEGLSELWEELNKAITSVASAKQSVVNSTVLRASDSLKDANNALNRALKANQHQLGEELVAAEIRQALNELGAVVGTVYTDDILDLVFGRFCIGK